MRVFYNEEDITEMITIRSATCSDYATGRFDNLEVLIPITTDEWKSWMPAKGDKLELRDEVTTGRMYVDYVQRTSAGLLIKALPLLYGKEKHTVIWEKATFMEICQELARKNDLELKTIGVRDVSYERMHQIKETDLGFLNHLAMLEGYDVKVYDGSLVIVNEKAAVMSPFVIRSELLLGEYQYRQKFSTLAGVQVQMGEYAYLHRVKSNGRIEKVTDLQVSSIGQAGRYAKNIYSKAVQDETILECSIRPQVSVVAGMKIRVEEMGVCDGLYFIDHVITDIGEEISNLYLRRIVND